MADTEEKIPYPKQVFLILLIEFCERFTFYGMRAVLSIFLRDVLLFSENKSKLIYHTFIMLAYFFPLFGAIISDGFLGKFYTILWLSIVYCIGNILLAFSAIDTTFGIQITCCFIGLLLIAIGTGGIKPCVTTFGGDQFTLPQQKHQLVAFFSLFYFSINAGSFLSTLITPILKKTVKCYGRNTCYPVAFAVPGMLMVFATVIFILGKRWYVITKPEENIILRIGGCIVHAIKSKFKRHQPQVDHWLDRAEPKYEKDLINDVKTVLKALLIFTPLPLFWALFDQQGSGWTFQATRMDGTVGNYTILPEHLQVANPIFILLLIPIFRYGIYPLFDKCHILNTPLQKMIVGGVLTAVAFIMSAILAFFLEAPDLLDVTGGDCFVIIYNPTKCQMILTAPPYFIEQEVVSMEREEILLKQVKNETVPYTITYCNRTVNGSDLQLVQNARMFYYLQDDDGLKGGLDDLEKGEEAQPRVRTITNKRLESISFTYKSDHEKLTVSAGDHSIQDFKIADEYKINDFDKTVTFEMGGVYAVLVNHLNGTIKDINLITVVDSNHIHILWLLPQYFVISIGELLLSITGLEFSYSQSPVRTKAFVMSCFNLTNAMGNLFVVIIEALTFFHKESHNFLFYAVFMLVDMLVFGFLSCRYIYVEHHTQPD